MNLVVWRSFLAALALVTLSGCAAETSTTDLDLPDEEPHSSSSPAAASEDEARAFGSLQAAHGVAPVAPQAEATMWDDNDLNGPRPEPWAPKPD